MVFTKDEALIYMEQRKNNSETLFAQTTDGKLIFENGDFINLIGINSFVYRGKIFIIESDFEKEFCRIFNERFVDVTYCIKNSENY